MPLVTDLFFTATNRIAGWRAVFTFSAAFSFGFLIMSPIIWHSLDKFGWGWRLTWIMLAVAVIVSAQRWYHWRQIQKQNIFNDDGEG